MKNLRETVEERCAGKGYPEIEKEIAAFSSLELLDLLGSKSRRLGDSAAGLLESRKETDLLLSALLNDRVRTPIAKIRAINVLNTFGRAIPEAIDGYLHVLDDPNLDVISDALFGIVFMRRRDLLPQLQTHLTHAAAGSERYEIFKRAIDALEVDDPSIYSPGFADPGNIWGLNHSD